MAGKTASMSQIKQLLLLKKQHVSNRSAAQMLGLNKETVNNYVRKAAKNGAYPASQNGHTQPLLRSVDTMA